MSDIFSATPIPENPLAELVGEGKKYATVDDLAKAYVHADRTIAQRNTELNEIRTDLQARLSVEEMIGRISTPAPAPAPVTPPANQPTAVVEPPVDVATLVQQELEKLNTTKTLTDNVTTVTTALVKQYGSEEAANRAITAKAAELGLPLEFLQDVATKSPKAFFTTIGLDPNATPAAPARPTSGDVNPAALANNPSVKAGTYAFYEQLRKSNPSLYFSPKIQNQMHKDAHANPEAFFNRG